MKTNRILFLTSVALITVGTCSLANAGEVIVEADHRVPIVQLKIGFHAGSASDPAGKTGVASLLSQLMRRGTTSKSWGEVNQALDSLGASLDGSTGEATFWFNGTVMPEKLNEYLDLAAEVILHPAFDQSQFEKLKKQAISSAQMALEDNDSVGEDQLHQLIFGSHPYGRVTQIKDLNAITLDDLKAFYSSALSGSNLIIAACGDVESTNLTVFQKKIETELNPNSKGIVTKIPAFTNWPVKHKVVLIDKPGQTQANIYIAHPGVALDDANRTALWVANEAFGHNWTSRLFKDIRDQHGWAYSVESYFERIKPAGFWASIMTSQNENAPKALAEVVKLIAEFGKNGITADEFAMQSGSIVNAEGFTYDTAAKRLGNTISEKLNNLPEHFWQNLATRVKALTLDDVNAAIKAFVQPDKEVILVVGTAAVLKAPIAKALGIQESDIIVRDYRDENE